MKSILDNVAAWFPRVLFAVVLVTIGLFLNGCASSFLNSASTKLDVEKEGLTIRYRSPKDQHVEYDPESGKLIVKAASSASLIEGATAAQADALGKMAEAVSTLAPLAKPAGK